MQATDILRKKRDGQALSVAEIDTFVKGVTHGDWPDYQASALLMAIVLRGMSPEETAALTQAMVQSGERLDLSDLPGPKVDKHSTGGIGDKTSLILAPLAAACGLIVPMMSGRGLGFTGGTLDKLEAIPGFRVGLSLPEFRAVLRSVGCALIGQTREIAPADKKLYALRDVTATVESIPLITSSILSKKIAEGIDGLILDVKCGHGAFMKKEADARALAQSLMTIGNAQGVRTRAFLTAMDAPLGRAVGNALEIRECIDLLRGTGDRNLADLSLHLAGAMLRLGGLASSDDLAQAMLRNALTSGRGLEKFRAIIAAQGGDPRVLDEPERLPRAPHQYLLRAPHAGYVTGIQSEQVGRAAMLLGAGRNRVEDGIDPAVGILVQAPVGVWVEQGEALAEIHHRAEKGLPAALELLQTAWMLGPVAPPPTPLVIDTFGSDVGSTT